LSRHTWLRPIRCDHCSAISAAGNYVTRRSKLRKEEVDLIQRPLITPFAVSYTVYIPILRLAINPTLIFMRLLPVYCCYLLIGLPPTLAAQQKDNFPTIRMEPYPEKGIYRFPAFTDGAIVMRDGMRSSQKLNFNISLNEMHFISEKGDTLSVAEPEAIRYISLQGTRFYYDKSYYQVIDSAGAIMLAFTQLLSIQQHRVSAYGMTEPHEGVRTYSFYSMNGKTDPIGKDEKITVTARDVYFFGDKYGHFVKVSKAFILEHFQEQQDTLKNFISTNRIRFHSYGDLIKLMQFCKGLQ
jgi:hypothetical protein